MKTKQTLFESSKSYYNQNKAAKFDEALWNDESADFDINEFEEGQRSNIIGMVQQSSNANVKDQDHGARRQTANVAKAFTGRIKNYLCCN